MEGRWKDKKRQRKGSGRTRKGSGKAVEGQGKAAKGGWKGGGRTVPYLQLDRTRRVLVASALARERALAVEGGEREVNGVSTMDTQLQR